MSTIIAFDDGLLGANELQIQIIGDMPSPCRYGDNNKEESNQKTADGLFSHLFFFSLSIQPRTQAPASAPANWHMIKSGAEDGAIPANVSENMRAIVTAGLAKEVDAVNQ